MGLHPSSLNKEDEGNTKGGKNIVLLCLFERTFLRKESHPSMTNRLFVITLGSPSVLLSRGL